MKVPIEFLKKNSNKNKTKTERKENRNRKVKNKKNKKIMEGGIRVRKDCWFYVPDFAFSYFLILLLLLMLLLSYFLVNPRNSHLFYSCYSHYSIMIILRLSLS